MQVPSLLMLSPATGHLSFHATSQRHFRYWHNLNLSPDSRTTFATTLLAWPLTTKDPIRISHMETVARVSVGITTPLPVILLDPVRIDGLN
jgi:hypothetical protein